MGKDKNAPVAKIQLLIDAVAYFILLASLAYITSLSFQSKSILPSPNPTGNENDSFSIWGILSNNQNAIPLNNPEINDQSLSQKLDQNTNVPKNLKLEQNTNVPKNLKFSVFGSFFAGDGPKAQQPTFFDSFFGTEASKSAIQSQSTETNIPDPQKDSVENVKSSPSPNPPGFTDEKLQKVSADPQNPIENTNVPFQDKIASMLGDFFAVSPDSNPQKTSKIFVDSPPSKEKTSSPPIKDTISNPPIFETNPPAQKEQVVNKAKEEPTQNYEVLFSKFVDYIKNTQVAENPATQKVENTDIHQNRQDQQNLEAGKSSFLASQINPEEGLGFLASDQDLRHHQHEEFQLDQNSLRNNGNNFLGYLKKLSNIATVFPNVENPGLSSSPADSQAQVSKPIHSQSQKEYDAKASKKSSSVKSLKDFLTFGIDSKSKGFSELDPSRLLKDDTLKLAYNFFDRFFNSKSSSPARKKIDDAIETNTFSKASKSNTNSDLDSEKLFGRLQNLVMAYKILDEMDNPSLKDVEKTLLEVLVEPTLFESLKVEKKEKSNPLTTDKPQDKVKDAETEQQNNWRSWLVDEQESSFLAAGVKPKPYKAHSVSSWRDFFRDDDAQTQELPSRSTKFSAPDSFLVDSDGSSWLADGIPPQKADNFEQRHQYAVNNVEKIQNDRSFFVDKSQSFFAGSVNEGASQNGETIQNLEVNNWGKKFNTFIASKPEYRSEPFFVDNDQDGFLVTGSGTKNSPNVNGDLRGNLLTRNYQPYGKKLANAIKSSNFPSKSNPNSILAGGEDSGSNSFLASENSRQRVEQVNWNIQPKIYKSENLVDSNSNEEIEKTIAGVASNVKNALNHAQQPFWESFKLQLYQNPKVEEKQIEYEKARKETVNTAKSFLSSLF